jgi:hypothetical protein
MSFLPHFEKQKWGRIEEEVYCVWSTISPANVMLTGRGIHETGRKAPHPELSPKSKGRIFWEGLYRPQPTNW